MMSLNLNEPIDLIEFNEQIQFIEKLSIKLNEMTLEQRQTGSERLAEFRILSSSTLKKYGTEQWLLANLFIAEKIKLNLLPSWKDIAHINIFFDSKRDGKIRNREIFIGKHKAISLVELEPLLNQFESQILNNKLNYHPLIWISQVRYWFMTIHPFVDANGRTCTLLADWLLALNGYLPLSHSSKLDSFIGGWDGRSHFSDLNFAVYKTLAALKHSYSVFLPLA